MQCDKIIDYIVHWLQQYAEKAGLSGFVVGVSGGIDSAVTSSLCAHTDLNVCCLVMPIHQEPTQTQRADQHISSLKSRFPNVTNRHIDLSSTYDCFVESLPDSPPPEQHELSLANTRARLRMSTLYYFASRMNALVVGTGNKVEDFGIGFYTKYGDGGVDISPIADLNKTEVYALGKALGVGEAIQHAAPTDGLWGDNRSDEAQIGASYAELEWAMSTLNAEDNIHKLQGRKAMVMEIYRTRHQANLHKMQPIPVCNIPEDWR